MCTNYINLEPTGVGGGKEEGYDGDRERESLPEL